MLFGVTLFISVLALTTSYPDKCPPNFKHFTKDTIPTSQIQCTGDSPEERRCQYDNVIVESGVILLISDEIMSPPEPVLCSSVTKTHQHAKYCPINVISREAAVHLIISRTRRKCIREMKVALAFGRLARANCYHSIFEDFLPIYETLLLYPSLFSHWTQLNPTADARSSSSVSLSLRSNKFHMRADVRNDMVLFVEDESPDYDTNYYTFKFWKRFFPHVLMIDKYSKTPENMFFVKSLVAGSNSSCVHYYHCDRNTYTTPGLANLFRQFVLAKVGISLEEQRKSNQFKEQPLTIPSDILSPKVKLVTIIQRSNQESRHLINLSDIVSSCISIFGVVKSVSGVVTSTCVVKYYNEMTLDDQIRQTFMSDVIICVHGGALGNMLFAKNRSTLIDIYPYSFPYSFHGLVNWIRYSMMESIIINHSPFEIDNAQDMYFRNKSSSVVAPLTPCLCNTTTRLSWFKCGFGKMFYRSAGMTVNIPQFTSHLSSALELWKLRQTRPVVDLTKDAPPISKSEFKKFSLAQVEPWYYPKVRAEFQSSVGATAVSVPPDCSSHPFFRPPRRRRHHHRKNNTSHVDDPKYMKNDGIR